MGIDPTRLKEHAEFLRNLALGLVRDEHDADDLVQETFAAALAAQGVPRGDLRGWLVGVVRNLASNFRRREGRRRRREQRVARSEPVSGSGADAQVIEARLVLSQGVAKLPEPARSMIMLRYYDGKSAAEIGERHGVTAKTVRVHLRRGLARLREHLKQAYGGTAWATALVSLAVSRPARGGWVTARRVRFATAAALVVGVGTVTYLVVKARSGSNGGGEARAKMARDSGETKQPMRDPRPGVATNRMDEPRQSQPTPATPDVVRAKAKPSAAPPAAKQPGPAPVLAKVHNQPLQPLPKRGYGIGWGREALWWSHGGRHCFYALRLGQYQRGLSLEYELWKTGRVDAPVPQGLQARQDHKLRNRAFAGLKRTWLFGRRISKGTLHQLPAMVHVMDSEPGVVLFERYLHHGHGNSLSYIDKSGHLRWTLRLEELFTAAERARFVDADHSVMWNKGHAFWVDEGRRKVLVHSVHGAIVEVDLDTGAVRRTNAAALLHVVRAPGPLRFRRRALELAAPERPAGLPKLLADIVGSESEPLELRLRAAAIAAYSGGQEPPEELIRSGLASNDTRRLARELDAFRHKGADLGRTLAALGGPDEGIRAARKELLEKWGRAALPRLRVLATDEKQKSVVRLRALHLHRLIAADVAVMELVPKEKAPGLLAPGCRDARLQLWCEKEIVAFGDAGAKALLGLIRDARADLQARREATKVLAGIRTEFVFPALVQLVGHADNIVRWHAQAGLVGYPPKVLDRRFSALLQIGSPADLVIAEYYRAHPNKGAIEPLLRAMERLPQDAKKREMLGAAVQRCAGRTIAERADPAAWRRALGR